MNLNKRLLKVASLIRQGSFVADIGTDHAYLTIYLMLNKIAKGAVASDINEGPCRKAVANIAEYGLSDRISVVKTDGITGIEKYRPDDIVIAGMGGELIWNIINSSLYTRQKGVRLILQPMTRAPKLREFLLGNGFNIIDEALVYDDKLYQIICAEYDGIECCWTDVELLIGKINIKKGDLLLNEHISLRINELEKIRRGKRVSGIPGEKEEALINDLKGLIL